MRMQYGYLCLSLPDLNYMFYEGAIHLVCLIQQNLGSALDGFYCLKFYDWPRSYTWSRPFADCFLVSCLILGGMSTSFPTLILLTQSP